MLSLTAIAGLATFTAVRLADISAEGPDDVTRSTMATIAATIEEAQEHEATVDPNFEVPKTCRDDLELGVYEVTPTHQQPGKAGRYLTVANAAVGDDDVYEIWSGALVATKDQGILLVEEHPQDPCAEPDRAVETVLVRDPRQRGGLRITSVDGLVLHLSTENGSHVDYDVLKQTFDGVPADTAIPEPTPEATGTPGATDATPTGG